MEHCVSNDTIYCLPLCVHISCVNTQRSCGQWWARTGMTAVWSAPSHDRWRRFTALFPSAWVFPQRPSPGNTMTSPRLTTRLAPSHPLTSIMNMSSQYTMLKIRYYTIFISGFIKFLLWHTIFCVPALCLLLYSALMQCIWQLNAIVILHALCNDKRKWDRLW